MLFLISGLGSSYAETFDNNELFQKDGTFARDVTTMDISTDGSSRLKIKKRGKFWKFTFPIPLPYLTISFVIVMSSSI
jgi:hypothetical protein